MRATFEAPRVQGIFVNTSGIDRYWVEARHQSLVAWKLRRYFMDAGTCEYTIFGNQGKESQ